MKIIKSRKVKFYTVFMMSTISALGLAETVRDEFGTIPINGAIENAYANNDGSANWIGSWQEINDNNDDFDGHVRVEGNRLRLEERPNDAGRPSVRRGVDLSTAISATLTFDFATTAGVDSGDNIRLQIRDNGSGFTTLENINGIAGASTGSRSYNISSFAGPNTEIEFIVQTGYRGTNELFFIDNVQINYALPPTPTQIYGTIYRDINNNGIQNGLDLGEPGITVNAYDDSGLVASTVTDANGDYILAGLIDTTKYRIEVVAPSYLHGSTAIVATNDTLVSVVTSPAIHTIGIQNGAQYCQLNPDIIMSRFTKEERAGANTAVNTILQYNYLDNGTTAPTNISTYGNIGSIYGLAHVSKANVTLASTYFKTHADIGSGGIGAIYKIDHNSANAISNFAVLPGTDPRGGAGGGYDWDRDSLAYVEVGKRAIGDIELSDDESTLFAVNMEDRRLYVMGVDDNGDLTTNTNVAIPNPCSNVLDYRPMGLGFRDGMLYVGVTCTAESTVVIDDPDDSYFGPRKGDFTELSAHIYSFNPNISTFSASPVLDIDLDYQRGCGYDGDISNVHSPNCVTTNDKDGIPRPFVTNWNPWQMDFDVVFNDKNPGNIGNQDNFLEYQQPLLSDIAFDNDGTIIVQIKDINGDRTGHQNLSPATPGDGGLHNGNSYGDILRACGNPTTGWTLENNASCGGITTGGAGTNEGPGNGEYYYYDNGPGGNGNINGATTGHAETTMGGLLQVPGHVDIITGVMDAHGTSGIDNGLMWLQNSGAQAGQVSLDGGGIPKRLLVSFDSGASFFGKASGIGDIEALCDPAPLEIGNYIWDDIDGDGIQDPSEAGIAGVTVDIYNAGVLVGTATTDANGRFFFGGVTDTNMSGVNVLTTNTTYQLRVNLADGNLIGKVPTLSDVDSNVNDTRDNDGDDGVLNPGFSTISYTTGSAGQNSHALDFGFKNVFAVIGNRVWLDLDNDGIQDANEDGISNRIVSLTPPAGFDIGAGVGNAITTVTDTNGNYLFPHLPLANGYVVTVTNPPAGLNQTFDEDGIGTAHTSLVDLTFANEEHLTADFGYVPPSGTIGDFIWIDANGDGQQDPEEIGIPNVDVYLCVANIAVCDSTTPLVDVVAMTTTDTNGHYLFTGIDLVSVNVVHVDTTTLPVGYVLTGDPDDVADSKTTIPALNTSNGINLDADFGYQPPAANHFDIGDTIYKDLNNDGNEDVGDPGIPGVTVQLFVDTTANGVPDTPVASAITDNDGKYLFPSLPGGVAYSVLVTDTNNILNDFAQSGDPDAVLDNQSTIASLLADNLDQDFGYHPLRRGIGTIGDRIFHDVDASGTQNAGDQGFEGVTVRLQNLSGDTLDTLVTDENGQYLFTGLDPSASYRVVVDVTTLPNAGVGWTNNIDPQGAIDGQSVVDLSLSPSGINLDQDFGFLGGLNAIEGTIWVDSDGDGLLDDPDELPNGIESVTVVLKDSDNNIIATTTTDANGDYSFTGLANGTYTVSVTDDTNELANLQHTDGPNANDNTIDNNSQDDTGYAVSVGGVFPILNTTADFGYKPVVTTPITLASFKTSYNQATGETILKWSTLTETGNIGFDVYRQVDGMWVQVNPVTIASKAVYSTKLVTYEYTYKGEYTREWALVDIDIKGRRQSHGVYEINKLYGVEDSIESLQSTHWDNIKQQHEGKVEERKQQKASAINDYIRSQQNKTLQSKGAGS